MTPLARKLHDWHFVLWNVACQEHSKCYLSLHSSLLSLSPPWISRYPLGAHLSFLGCAHKLSNYVGRGSTPLFWGCKVSLHLVGVTHDSAGGPWLQLRGCHVFPQKKMDRQWAPRKEWREVRGCVRFGAGQSYVTKGCWGDIVPQDSFWLISLNTPTPTHQIHRQFGL